MGTCLSCVGRRGSTIVGIEMVTGYSLASREEEDLHMTLHSNLVACIGGFLLGMPAFAQEFATPEPLAVAHEAIHAELEQATRVSGAVGEAATAVMDVLQPHFEKEEQYVMPQLGLLPHMTGGPLANGDVGLSADVRQELIARTERLNAELPQMLEEHRRIEAALLNLEQVATSEGYEEYAELAREIGLHAREEELVTYPTAVLMGEHARQSDGAGR